jgi:hypothetical protein
MEKKIIDLINKSEITSVVNSYFGALDDKNFNVEHLSTIFTDDAKIIRPNGVPMIGPVEASASHAESFTRFEGSQHILTNHDISITGEKATVRANLVAMHIWNGSNTMVNNPDNFFIAGGVIHAELVKLDERWKISQISSKMKWRGGAFNNMAQTK